MTIEIKEGRYMAALFFLPVQLNNDLEGDLMGAIYRDPGETAFTMIYRMRWYRDASCGLNSNDEKRWYKGVLERLTIETAEAHEERAVGGIAGALLVVAGMAPRGPISLLRPRSDDPNVTIEMFRAHPEWAHMFPAAGQA